MADDEPAGRAPRPNVRVRMPPPGTAAGARGAARRAASADREADEPAPRRRRPPAERPAAADAPSARPPREGRRAPAERARPVARPEAERPAAPPADAPREDRAGDRPRRGARGPARSSGAHATRATPGTTSATRLAPTRAAAADPAPAATATLDASIEDEAAPEPPSGDGGRARNTIIFGIATGLSRIAGLLREVVAGTIYGASGPASAFTLAFAVPNLLRSLFADMALSAAFVPVFTDLLEQKKKREALLLASTLFWVLLIGLGILVAVAELTAPLYMQLFFTEDVRASGLESLTVGLSQVMLPTVLLLGLNGLLVGILNAYDHFTIPALSPLVWNGVIIALNLALLPVFDGQDEIYAQAIGVLVGTVIQLGMAVPVLRRYRIRLVPKIDWRDPRLRQVLLLMIPVALSLGLINFSALVDSTLGFRLGESVPRQIDAAFRLYMLPQGVFSVAIVTVLFPALARAVSRGDQRGMRGLLGSGTTQILVLLVPVGVLFLNPLVSQDIIGTIFQRGAWTEADTIGTATALVWFGPNLPLNGISLLLSRTFFAMQRPWANTGLALASLLVNVGASVAMYRPLGIAGIVLGTLVGNVFLVGAQIWLLRRITGGPLGLLPVVRTLVAVVLASLLAVLVLSIVAFVGERVADPLAPTFASIATLLYLLLAVIAGGLTYVGTMRGLGVVELDVAGARFARVGARIGGVARRLPGVPALLERGGSPGAARRLGQAAVVLGILALPLRLLVRLAEAIARPLQRFVDRFGGPEQDDGPGDDGPFGPDGGLGGPGPATGVVPDVGAGSPFGTPEDAAVGAQALGDPATGAQPAVAPHPVVPTRPAGPTAGGPPSPSPASRPAADPAAAPPRGGGPGPVAPYDAAADWPTAGVRDEGTLDVPWPVAEPPRHAAPPIGATPDADAPRSVLDAYGIDPGRREQTPEELARAERREAAQRMLAAREEALERMAERQRARRERDERGGGRGRRGRRH